MKVRVLLHRRTSRKFDISVIPGTTPHYSSQTQLKEALVDEKSVIVIKDPKLANKIVSWLKVGRCIHDMSIFIATGSIICSCGVDDSILRFGKPLAIGCVLMNVGYCYFWKSHALENYKVAQGPSMISTVMNNNTNPTILVRKVEPSSTKFHTLVTIGALITALWKDLVSYDFKESFKKLNVFKHEKQL